MAAAHDSAFFQTVLRTPLLLLCAAVLLQFDGVLENISQDVVYNNCVHEAVDSSLAGYNSTVFAYGQVCAEPAGRKCRTQWVAVTAATQSISLGCMSAHVRTISSCQHPQ